MSRDPSFRAAFENTLRDDDGPAAVELLEDLADSNELADFLIDQPPERIVELAELIGDDSFGELLGELDPGEAADVLGHLAVADAADVLEAMDPDEAADVVLEIAPDEADRLLIAMEPVEAAELRELMLYPPDTAGGRMTPAFVSIAPDLRADQTVVALQRLAQEAETITYVYVTDDEERLLGVLSLRSLVLNPPDTPVSELMVTDVVTIPVTVDQEVAARELTQHELRALPVIDEDRRLVGIITYEDVADILEQEATEDIERLGGSAPLAEPYLRASPILLWRKRVGWLLVLFLGQAYTGSILAHYESVFEAAASLVYFMPLLIGTGGNAGSQVVSTIVRAMALGDVRFRDMFRIVRKEFLTGVMLGLMMASAVFVRALILGVGIDIGLVVAITITAIVIWAVIVGAVLPLVLAKLKVDPAVVSAPFISSLVDGTGLLIYFSLAQLILNLD